MKGVIPTPDIAKCFHPIPDIDCKKCPTPDIQNLPRHSTSNLKNSEFYLDVQLTVWYEK